MTIIGFCNLFNILVLCRKHVNLPTLYSLLNFLIIRIYFVIKMWQMVDFHWIRLNGCGFPVEYPDIWHLAGWGKAGNPEHRYFCPEKLNDQFGITFHSKKTPWLLIHLLALFCLHWQYRLGEKRILNSIILWQMTRIALITCTSANWRVFPILFVR